jgi:hypothetical protein
MTFKNIQSIVNFITHKCVASKKYCTSQYGKYVLFHLPPQFISQLQPWSRFHVKPLIRGC